MKVPEDPTLLTIALVMVGMWAIWNIMSPRGDILSPAGNALETMLDMLRVFAAMTLSTTLLIALVPFAFLTILFVVMR